MAERSGRRRARVAEDADRLDRALTAVFEGLGRREARVAVTEGRVFVDGYRCRTVGRPVPAGAELLLYPPRAHDPPPPAEILCEDDAWLVVDKPVGIAVNPSETSPAEALVERYSDRDARVVHRLDRDTTGVMVLAKGPKAAAVLSRAFADRAVEKVYLAWVEGEGLDAVVDDPIGSDKRRPRARAVRPDGQPAETAVRTLAARAGIALVEARPHTGRTHQIRVHLAHKGQPILGDVLYGGPSAVRLGDEVVRIGRPLLHAARLVLPHPDGPRAFTAEPPSDFQRLQRWVDER